MLRTPQFAPDSKLSYFRDSDIEAGTPFKMALSRDIYLLKASRATFSLNSINLWAHSSTYLPQEVLDKNNSPAQTPEIYDSRRK